MKNMSILTQARAQLGERLHGMQEVREPRSDERGVEFCLQLGCSIPTKEYAELAHSHEFAREGHGELDSIENSNH